VNLIGQPAHVGRFCGSNTYEISREVVDFYADALDDHHPLFEEFAPPLLHHSECYKCLGEWYLKNLFGNLHAQQDWELFAPIRVGRSVRTLSTIVDRFSKRGRDYVVNETDLYDAQEGHLLVRGRTFQSFLPPRSKAPDADAKDAGDGGGFVVDTKTAAQKKERAPFPTATGSDLDAIEKSVDERRCWMFSGPGKNYHTDREQALNLGFPNIVVQGMMSTCFVSQLMQNAFGMGWLSGGRMSLKLTNVLWVDESVRVQGRIKETLAEGTGTRIHCEVWADKSDGTRIALGTASAFEA
jgi:hypothetical protein